ncbi:hypothetical protein [uncultured Sphingomonas sp.]|uniref:hypothetical protein n=1 Tax=uncultured Sphingomonas sp. TaxID=158754 RepID=UPI00374A5779
MRPIWNEADRQQKRRKRKRQQATHEQLLTYRTLMLVAGRKAHRASEEKEGRIGQSKDHDLST